MKAGRGSKQKGKLNNTLQKVITNFGTDAKLCQSCKTSDFLTQYMRQLYTTYLRYT